jgi:hypothetical protein
LEIPDSPQLTVVEAFPEVALVEVVLDELAVVVAEVLAIVALAPTTDEEMFWAIKAVATSACVPDRGTVAEPHSTAPAVKYVP